MIQTQFKFFKKVFGGIGFEVEGFDFYGQHIAVGIGKLAQIDIEFSCYFDHFIGAEGLRISDAAVGGIFRYRK